MNVVKGNWIGTTPTDDGTKKFGNKGNGVFIAGQQNTGSSPKRVGKALPGLKRSWPVFRGFSDSLGQGNLA